MSIEFFAVPRPAIPAADIGELLRGLASAMGYWIVREARAEIGLVAGDADDRTRETITIGLECDRAYVAFHGASGAERARAMEAAENYLQRSGYRCEFKED